MGGITPPQPTPVNGGAAPGASQPVATPTTTFNIEQAVLRGDMTPTQAAASPYYAPPKPVSPPVSNSSPTTQSSPTKAVSTPSITTPLNIGSYGDSGTRWTGTQWVPENTYRALVDAGAFAKPTAPPVGYVGGTYNPVTGETTGGHPGTSQLLSDESKAAPEPLINTKEKLYTDIGINPLPTGKNDIPIINQLVNTDAPFYNSADQLFYNLPASTVNEVVRKNFLDEIKKPLPEGYTYGEWQMEYNKLPMFRESTKERIDKNVYQDSNTGTIFVDSNVYGVPKPFLSVYAPQQEDIQQKLTEDPVRPLSFGGAISDITKSYYALRKGDILGSLGNYEQAVSRYTTRAAMPDITGLGDKIVKANIPTNFETPFGTIRTPIQYLQASVPYAAEQFYQDIRKNPLQDIVFLGIPGAMETVPYAGSSIRAAAATSKLPVVSTFGKLFSTPSGLDITRTAWTGAKVAVGGLFVKSSVENYQAAPTTEAKSRVVGSIAEQVTLMGIGSKYFTPTYVEPNNPFLSKTMSGEFKLPVTTKIHNAIITAIEAPFSSSPKSFKGISDVWRDVRTQEPQPGIVQTEVGGKLGYEGLKGYSAPDLNKVSTIGPARSSAVTQGLLESDVVIKGSAVVRGQVSGMESGRIAARPSVDADVLSPDMNIMTNNLAKYGETTVGMDVKSPEAGYPDIFKTKITQIEQPYTGEGESWIARYLGNPVRSIVGEKLPIVDEVHIAGKTYRGEIYKGLSEEQLNVQFSRKVQAWQEDLMPGNKEQYRLIKDSFDAQAQARDIIYSNQAKSGIKVGTPTKSLTKLDAMRDMTVDFNFIPDKDIPILGAKVGVRYTATKNYGELWDAFRNAPEKTQKVFEFADKPDTLQNIAKSKGSISTSPAPFVGLPSLYSAVNIKTPSPSYSTSSKSSTKSLVSSVVSVSAVKSPSINPSKISSPFSSPSPSPGKSPSPFTSPSPSPGKSPSPFPSPKPSPSPSPFKSPFPSPSPSPSPSPFKSPFPSPSPSPIPYKSPFPSPNPSIVPTPGLPGITFDNGGGNGNLNLGRKNRFTETFKVGKGLSIKELENMNVFKKRGKKK
jgi:hypothetical protein